MTRLMHRAGTLPFLIAVFLNAFVDLGHKIVIQNTIFKIHDGPQQIVLTAILNALILLPFILLFSPAGFASDRYPKHKVMRVTAWAAVALTSGITLCYLMGWFWASFAMTFLLAAQSALYSPAKFGYIRGFFGKEHLAEANGIVSAISIIAILTGTFAFSIVFESVFPDGATTKTEVLTTLVPVGLILMLTSIVELVMMYRLPQADTPIALHSGPTKFSHTFSSTLLKSNLAPVLKRDVIRLSIIGLAMFWSIGQVMLAAFPAFAKAQTGESNTIIIQAILGASGLGIALGSMIASRASKNYIETGLIPLGAAGIALGLAFLPTLESQIMMGLDFFFIGAMGGIFIVPLNAMVQFYANEHELGKVLAGNNLIQNIAMFSFLCVTVSFALLGISAKQLLIFTAIFALLGGCYTVSKLPQSLVRFVLSLLMSRRYRVNVQGMKNIPSEGGVLLLGNHITWIDWAIIQIASPRPVQFVMHKRIYERWYLTWFFKMFGSIPIEKGASSKASLDTIAQRLNQGHVVCLFPEGALSRTGHLGEFKRGFERAAAQCNDDVVIQPLYLRGLWGSQFSYSSEKLRQQSVDGWKREIIIAFGKPIDKNSKADIVKRRVFDLSVSSWQSYAENLPSLPHAWINTCKHRGKALAIADTSTHQEMSAERLLTAAIAFSKRIKKISPEQNIGLLVPTSAGGVIANMATLMLGKTLVNLNYTSNPDTMSSALEQAEINTIYTSEKFLKKLQARGLDFSECMKGKHIVYLEEIKQQISNIELLRTLINVKLLPAFLLKRLVCRRQSPDHTAAILFSSGSEGTPKGIRLSHTNIMANLKQISDVLNMEDNEVFMASLPLFHAFGLTVTQFLPLIEGLPMICHADPTDAVGTGKAIAKYKATVMCATSTFLRLYTRNQKVHPLMLNSLRLVISGAEKLNPEVREAFKHKFNKDILEGYGATETTPVASVNVPSTLDTSTWRIQLGEKLGTVGMPLPGTSFKVVDPETWEELPSGHRGMILIGGAQVMQGYINAPEKTASVIRKIGNTRWYVTGDKGYLDEDGFLTIVDRYSRFAKLGGEMVSLSSVESAIVKSLTDEYRDLEVVAVNLPDEKKGEKIVILSERDISTSELKSAMLSHQCNGLMIPSEVILVDTLPKLGSGKTDFKHAKMIASNATAAPNTPMETV
ncbi:MAG: acyl-[ACP]--phospholipid O-acyltransferase [Agarilytica sp.]